MRSGVAVAGGRPGRPWQDVRVTSPRVRWVLLNHRSNGWSFSIAEVPEAIGCGRLNDLPTDAPFEMARDAVAEIVREGYGVEISPAAWAPSDDGGWGANLDATNDA